VYPGGQIGTGLPVLGGDPRSTVGGGSGAAELGGSTDGTEMISAWTAMDATKAKTRANAPVDNAAAAGHGDGSAVPDDDLASGREPCVAVVRMGEI
jgi:hypothetical protein